MKMHFEHDIDNCIDWNPMCYCISQTLPKCLLAIREKV